MKPPAGDPPPSASPPPPGHDPLSAVRARIDAVDHEILQALARRHALVAEIAAAKRVSRTPIRDYAREHQIIDDRRTVAASLGLSAELIESVWRLILWGSRDRQAALQTELPLDIQPRTVAIIGGRGAMGRCMAQLFGDLGHTVIIADLDTQPTPQEAAAAADVVLISVPIASTVDVIRDLGPRLRPDALLMDVTSVKAAPLAAMLESTTASVVGTHPLFGPSVHSLQGQRVVLTPGRGDTWRDWLQTMLHARGLIVLETTAAEHDRTMSVVQVLTHFALEVTGKALAATGQPLSQTLAFMSPIYLITLLLVGRHFAQSPDLYAAIQMLNAQTPEVTGAFVAAAEALRSTTMTGDLAAFRATFDEVRRYLGDFSRTALAQSDFLIDRLVERL